jgi:hypothetical protein
VSHNTLPIMYWTPTNLTYDQLVTAVALCDDAKDKIASWSSGDATFGLCGAIGMSAACRGADAYQVHTWLLESVKYALGPYDFYFNWLAEQKKGSPPDRHVPMATLREELSITHTEIMEGRRIWITDMHRQLVECRNWKARQAYPRYHYAR